MDDEQDRTERAAMATALASMQAEFKTVKCNREVTVKMKGGGSFSYSYATYDHLLDEVRPLLAKHHFSLTNSTSIRDGKLSLRSCLMYENGESISSTLPVKGTGNAQDLGSELSYMRRYAAACILGVAFEEEDDDANPARRPPEPAAGAPARQKRQDPPAPQDDAVIRGRHLWAQTNTTGEACGLDRPERETLLRSVIDELLGLDDEGNSRSTKTITEKEHVKLIDRLKEIAAENTPPEEN